MSAVGCTSRMCTLGDGFFREKQMKRSKNARAEARPLLKYGRSWDKHASWTASSMVLRTGPFPRSTEGPRPVALIAK